MMIRKQKKEFITKANEGTSGFKIQKKKDNCDDIQVSSSSAKEGNADFKNVTVRKFTIPKKTADDWNKDIQTISPLSRVANPDNRTVTFWKHGHNMSRNNECHEYYKTFRNCRTNRIGHNIEFQNEADSGKDVDTKYPEKIKSTVESKEQPQEAPFGEVCQRDNNRLITLNKDSTHSSGSSQGSPIPGTAAEQITPRRNRTGSECKHGKSYKFKGAGNGSMRTSSSPPNAKLENSAAYLLSSEPSSDMSLDLEIKVIDTNEETKKSYPSGCLADLPADNAQSCSNTKLMSKRKSNTLISCDENKREHKKMARFTSVIEPSIEIKDDLHENLSSYIKEAPDYSDAEVVLKTAKENLVLQFNLLNVFFGQVKGTPSGSAKFTATSIEIPLKVFLHESRCFTLDPRMLQKFGLWFIKSEGRISTYIILWITTDYVPHCAKQMELPPVSQASKSNELIFLELAKPPTRPEQFLLYDIMKESSKNGSPTLADKLTWKEMYDMLGALSPTESCFKKNNPSFQNLQSLQSRRESAPAKASEVKSCYTVVVNSEEDIFSFSVTKEKDTLQMEAKESLVRLVVYPPPPTKGGHAITEEDLDCLEDGAFLNDVIIDFYLKYLMLEKVPPNFAEKCHVFSSFFYLSLVRKDSASSQLLSAQERHQRVKTWTRHVDIFSKDFIFVPVNEHSHWYLAVICFPGMEEAVFEETSQIAVQHIKTNPSSVIVFNDEVLKIEESESCASEESRSNQEHPIPKQNNGKYCKRPCIIVFDSLKSGSVYTTVKVLREYLKVEWNMKKKTPPTFIKNMVDIFPKVPKQSNGTDCGLYLLHYAESFFEKPIKNFNPPMRLENWFTECEVKNKRHQIRDLILKLHIEQKKNGLQLTSIQPPAQV